MLEDQSADHTFDVSRNRVSRSLCNVAPCLRGRGSDVTKLLVRSAIKLAGVSTEQLEHFLKGRSRCS